MPMSPDDFKRTSIVVTLSSGKEFDFDWPSRPRLQEVSTVRDQALDDRSYLDRALTTQLVDRSSTSVSQLSEVEVRELTTRYTQRVLNREKSSAAGNVTVPETL